MPGAFNVQPPPTQLRAETSIERLQRYWRDAAGHVANIVNPLAQAAPRNDAIGAMVDGRHHHPDEDDEDGIRGGVREAGLEGRR